jgi:hypothetical protein
MPRRDGPDFTVCEAERLTTGDMLEPNRMHRLGSPITLEESVRNRDRKHYGNPKRGDDGAVENCTAARASAGVSGDHGAARRA